VQLKVERSYDREFLRAKTGLGTKRFRLTYPP
jgi:hypothetical protein